MTLVLRKMPRLGISVHSVAVLNSIRRPTTRLRPEPFALPTSMTRQCTTTSLHWNFIGLTSATQSPICCSRTRNVSTGRLSFSFAQGMPSFSTAPISCSSSNMSGLYKCFSSQSKPTDAVVGGDNHTHNDHGRLEQEGDMVAELEWDHPSMRTENAVANDPELRSLLCEIAADFGKSDKSVKTDDAESVVDKENATSPPIATMTPVTVGEEHRSEGSFVSKTTEDENSDGPVNSSLVKDATNKSNASFVFSVDDIVDILRDENAGDICVIRVPVEKNYVDYFIVVTGRSTRHLSAMTQHINKLYKHKKCEDDPFLIIEGKLSDDWMCLDFGNIVVHFMLEDTRVLYDLEKLWMLGKEFDDHIQQWDQHEVLLFNPETDLEVEDPGGEMKDYPEK